MPNKVKFVLIKTSENESELNNFLIKELINLINDIDL
jgi:hypothetical protein